ncbi:uncharacterized protein DUF1206 [Labedella gwakjiensis]|uniref:DUF1206 domain-containing protein n=1 Tax=Labedella gwakjiensis TaxID=390269 RepID=A0A2P8GSZ6_9MICO|nr:DUF1206 domain-containing protein [Labedella gwakjiensis]PSL37096.1 uncharacterized protein DUF1206 [Labedella gwakjiensis]RUQ82001.1 DUF1206 domain-containing protein [Labedella gwakjiensis]
MGLVANGLVHVLIGGIAVGVAFGAGGDAGQSGVLNAIATTPGGFLVLWVAAIGLWGLAIFQLTDAAWVGTRDPAKIAYRRTKALGKSLGFAGIGLLAAFIALGGRSDGDSTAQRFSEWALDSPVGGAILVITALLIGALGVGFGLRGVNRTFREDLSTPSGALGAAVTVVGVVGHVAKGISFLLVGGLLLSAAIVADPQRAGGLDGALSAVRDRPYGPALLLVIAVGLIAFGVYLGARARYLRR